MTALALTPRALLHFVFNGARAVDVLETALSIGILARLDRAPASLGELADEHALLPKRLFKFMDCLESLGLVRREPAAALGDTRYTAVPGLLAAAQTVLGDGSQERDRERYAWHAVHRRLAEVLRGTHAMPREAFVWPLADPDRIAAFEASMVAGLPPIVATFQAHAEHALGAGPWLDVGGGDGTLAAEILRERPGLVADVFNLPATEPLVRRTAARYGIDGRLGFRAGDFLDGPLPEGYAALSFVRVLHDWDDDVARALLRAAHAALPAGGRVLVCEEFRTAERLAAQFFWSYFLIGVDSCQSRLREIAFYRAALADAGFRDVEVRPGPFELIVATR